MNMQRADRMSSHSERIDLTLLKRQRALFPVLLVDDDLVYLELAKLYLEEAGYRVTTVESGEQALSLLSNEQYRIVLCDWMMPGLDGLSLIRHLRSTDTIYRYLILLTSKSAEEEIVRGFSAGADDYILKGCRKTEMVVRLDAGLRMMMQQALLEDEKLKLLRQAQSDALTGLFNKGYLTEHLLTEVFRAMRYGENLSILICDIDHFKKVNDHYGHLAGDQVLKRFANHLVGRLRRRVDWVARFGGEEFVVVLPVTAEQEAISLAEELRSGVEALEMDWQGTTFKITASFGVACMCPSAGIDSIDRLMQLADERLYQSKQNGRNRVTGS